MKTQITYIKKNLATLIIAGFLLSANSVNAQGFNFAAGSGSFTALSGGTNPSFTGSADDGYMNAAAGIGFTFTYWGTDYTTFALTTNGCMTLGQAFTTSHTSNNLSTNAARPIIAPLWDDLDCQAFTNITYQLSGSPGSQILTVEWLNMQWWYAASGNTLSFQVKLYEGTNKIEYVYRDEGGTVVSASASIGLAGPFSNEFVSLNGTGATPSMSWTTETTTLNTKPATGQIYAFTPTGAQMCGTYTIKSSGGDYTNFSDAIKDLNVRGVSCAVTFNADPGLSVIEDCPIVYATGTAANTITFQKAGAGTNPVIKPTGGAGTTDAGISIFGGDYFTFDGIDITEAAGSAVEYGYYLINASATNGAQNNTVKNCKITLNRSNTSARGIYQNVATAPTNATGANSNNKFQTVTIENSYCGIYVTGNATYPDLNMEVSGCTIGAATANDIGNGSSAVNGIRMTSSNSASVFGNEIRNATGTGSNHVYGLFLESIQGTSSVYNNKVHDITFSGTSTSYYVYGIRTDINSGNTCNVYNNMVYALQHGITSASATQVIRAVAVGVSGTGTGNFYYNSVRLDEDQYPSSTCFYSNGGTISIKDNIFANVSTAGATSKRYCIYFNSGTLSASNYNDFFINTAGTNNNTGYYSAADRNTLVNWQTATGKDGNSINADPGFMPASYLHANGAAIDGTGVVISVANGDALNITTDYDGDIRNTSTPDIGADEISLVPCATPTYANGNLAATASSSGQTLFTVSGSFTAAPNPPTGYMVVRTDAYSQPAPVDGTTYSVGSSAIGYIEYISTSAGAWVSTGLSTGTTYYYWVFSYNSGTCAGPVYSPTSTEFNATTLSCPSYSGTLTVGGGGSPTFADLTTAIQALTTCGYTGNIILELQSGYSGAGETYPITFNSSLGSGPAKTITIRPATGATGLSITSANTTATIDLNGVTWITFDGRPGGTGSRDLVISNTSIATGGCAIRFINSSTNNTVKYVSLLSSYPSTNGGVVYFTTGSNSTNTIDNCGIDGNAGSAAAPTLVANNGVYSSGTANNNNSITNCSIFNNWVNGSTNCGILLSSGSSGWTISGNSFYQTSTRTTTAATLYYGIYLNNASGNGYTVSGNYIGGTSSICGGTPLTVGGSYTNKIMGIDITATASPVSNIQGNTINNINWTTSSGTTTPGSMPFNGIIVRAGGVNVGTTSGNTIGATTGTGSPSSGIYIINTTTGTGISAIYLTSTSACTISNNNIGAIGTGGAAGMGYSFYGIYVEGAANHVITSNYVGGSTTGSIAIGTTGTTTATCNLYGIYTASAAVMTIGGSGAGNTIQNLSHNSSGGGLIYGIYNTGAVTGTSSISYNIIDNLDFTAVSTSANCYLIYNTGANSASTLNITNNSLGSKAVNYTGATGGTGSFYGIRQAATPLHSVISNNDFNN